MKAEGERKKERLNIQHPVPNTQHRTSWAMRRSSPSVKVDAARARVKWRGFAVTEDIDTQIVIRKSRRLDSADWRGLPLGFCDCETADERRHGYRFRSPLGCGWNPP